MSIATRFEAKCEPVTESGCWIWTAATSNKGYGVMGVGSSRVMLAHRIAWTLYNGEIPAGLRVLHKCDTPACVNPSHLFLGTQRDNVHDMQRKGRSPYRGGEDRGLAKLSDRDAQEILEAVGTHREIAARYGVDHSQVTRIKGRKAWRHV
jgi:hypothetical protein